MPPLTTATGRSTAKTTCLTGAGTRHRNALRRASTGGRTVQPTGGRQLGRIWCAIHRGGIADAGTHRVAALHRSVHHGWSIDRVAGNLHIRATNRVRRQRRRATGRANRAPGGRIGRPPTPAAGGRQTPEFIGGRPTLMLLK